MRISVILFLLALFIFSCNNNTSSPAKTNLTQLKDSIFQQAKVLYSKDAKKKSQSFRDYLYEHACFHLAKQEVKHDSLDFSDALYLSKIAWQSGWYDQAKDYAVKAEKLAKHKTEQIEAILAKWNCDLNAMDTIASDATLQLLNGLGIPADYSIQLLYNLNLGYHFHNKRDFRKSIEQYHFSIGSNQLSNREDSLLLANAYHKMGNSFNDIFRLRLTTYPTAIARDSAFYYYKKSLALNKVLLPSIHPRVGITYITMGMIEKSALHLDTAEALYFEAFKHLTTLQHTIQPVYTSIALTQLSETYKSKYQQSLKPEHLSKAIEFIQWNNLFLKNELVNYSTNAGRENLVKYFNQRSLEDFASFIGEKYTEGIYPVDTTLLELSTQEKYAGTIKSFAQNNGVETVDTDKDDALRMINELIILNAEVEDEEIKQRLFRWEEELLSLSSDAVKKYQMPAVEKIKKVCKDKKTVILDYSLINDKVFIHRFSDTGAALIVKSLENSNIDQGLPERLYHYMLNNEIDSFQLLSNECYKKLLQPAVTKIDTRVTVIPSQFLALLPWDALATNIKTNTGWSNIDYASKDRQFTHLISLNQINYFNRKDNKEGFYCFLPNFSEENRLIETENLLDHLNETYGASIKSGEEVDIKHISTLQASVVHFASHTSTTGYDKKLLLNDGSSLSSFYGNIGKFKASLVVLNACETQKGKFIKAEGYYNLPKLFIANGSSAVISSLWNVDEVASAYFFKQFYNYINKGYNKDKALNEVKKSFITNPKFPDWSNPYYWSAYLLTGCNKPISLK